MTEYVSVDEHEALKKELREARDANTSLTATYKADRAELVKKYETAQKAFNEQRSTLLDFRASSQFALEQAVTYCACFKDNNVLYYYDEFFKKLTRPPDSLLPPAVPDPAQQDPTNPPAQPSPTQGRIQGMRPLPTLSTEP